MKTVISVRLSPERITAIDTVARRLGMTRSEVIDAALRILPDLVSGKCELKFDPKLPAGSLLRNYNATS